MGIQTRKPSFFGSRKMRALTSLLISKRMMNILDLGSGPTLNNRYHGMSIYGVDIRGGNELNVFKCNLSNEKLPFEDNFFGCISAFDVLEHIPRVAESGGDARFPFIELMNEIWRCLEPNGIFVSSTPCYPHFEAFQDPTHVNVMTEDTLGSYFGDKAWGRIYGFHGTFKVEDEFWNGPHFVCVMKKINVKNVNLSYKQC